MSDLKKIVKENATDYANARKAGVNIIDLFINIGDRLIIAKSEFDSAAEFNAWVSETHPFNSRQSYKYIRIATHKDQARMIISENSDVDIDGMQKLLPKITDAPIETEADPDKLGYVGTKPGEARDSDNWHTPEEYIEAAREVLGGIDLDPFSDNAANERVKAERIFTRADDAFKVSWADPEIRTVWMNPPYSKGASSLAVDKFIEEFNYGSFDQAVVLMNSSTDTNWFHRMVEYCSALCFTKGRISFIDGSGKKSSNNTKGQVFFYFGRNVDKFRGVFSKYGIVLPKGADNG